MDKDEKIVDFPCKHFNGMVEQVQLVLEEL
jgi:hypothetical protein